MSEDQYGNFDTDGEGIKQLRKNYKGLKEQLEALQVQNQELMKGHRGASVNEALAARGLDPRIARFYPQDLSTDTESVDKWVEDNGELFAGRRVTDDQQQTQETTLTDAELRGYQVQQDIAAFEAAIANDFKSQFDQVEMTGNNWQAAQADVMRVLKEIGNNMAT
jgi:hypothetical protein